MVIGLDGEACRLPFLCKSACGFVNCEDCGGLARGPRSSSLGVLRRGREGARAVAIEDDVGVADEVGRIAAVVEFDAELEVSPLVAGSFKFLPFSSLELSLPSLPENNSVKPSTNAIRPCSASRAMSIP